MMMKVGSDAETITVAGDSPMLEVSKPSNIITVQGEFQRSVPLTGRRNWSDFLELTPTATELLNHYYESEIEFRAAGRKVEADLCKKAFDEVWKQDTTWEPYFIVNSVPQQSNSGWSFNLVASAASEQPETSNRFPNYCG